MSTQIGTIHVLDTATMGDRWEGFQSVSGFVGTTNAGAPVTLRINRVRAGVTHTLRLSGTITSTTGTVGMTVNGTTVSFPVGTNSTVTVPAGDARPIVVTITGAQTVRLSVTIVCAEDVPSRGARPCDVLALDAMRNNGTITNLTPNLTRLTVQAGTTPGAMIPTAEVGTLKASLRWPQSAAHTADLLNSHWGRPVVLYHWPTRAVVWAGTLVNVAVTAVKGATQHAEASLEAVDAVAVVASTTRYGATIRQNWTSRVANLATTLPAPLRLAFRMPSTTATTLAPTVWETSLAEHLDAMCVTASGGAWWLDHSTQTFLIAQDLRADSTAVYLTLTDSAAHGTPTFGSWGAADVWHYSAIEHRDSLSSMKITATVHNAVQEAGAWKAADVTMTSTPTVVGFAEGFAAYSLASTQLDCLLPAQTGQEQLAVKDVLSAITRQHSTRSPIQSVTVPIVTHRTTPTLAANAMRKAATTPLMAKTSVRYGHRQWQTRIRAVKHDITASTWLTTLYL